MEESGNSFTSAMLIGHYTHEIDSKKRLTLPSKWRKSLGEKVVLTTGLDKSLFLFTVSEWEEMAKKLSSLSLGSSESRNFNRFFLSNAFELEIDSQGRIVIPETLREYANLKETLILAGMYTRIEIWNEDAWNTCLSDSVHNANTVAEELSKLGVL